MLNIKPEEENQRPLSYRGFWKAVNKKPEHHILIWCSDWNKDHWGFYCYINTESHEKTKMDLINALALIDHLNFRDGDVYVEFIDYSREETKYSETIYKKLYSDQSWYLLGQLSRWTPYDLGS